MKRLDLSWLQHFDFKLWHNYTIQIAGAITAAAAVLLPLFGKDHLVMNVLGVASILLMAAAAFLGHFHNVDGTPQSQPGPAVPQLTAPPKVKD